MSAAYDLLALAPTQQLAPDARVVDVHWIYFSDPHPFVPSGTNGDK